MAIQIQTKKGLTNIAIEGEMTIFVAQELRDALREPLMQFKQIEVDLSQVTEMDAAGLQMMIVAKAEVLSRGNQLQFINHSQAVQEVFALTNIGSFFGDPVVIESTTA